jgi:aminoglycoside/choline kinase family phosphotransferase
MESLKFRDISPVLAKFLARYGFGEGCDIALAGSAGSRRVYFRLSQGLRTFIVLVSPPDDADFGRFLRITQFYRLMDVHVPMVHCIDDAAHQVLLEDLGDRRLFDLVVSGDGAATLRAYKDAIHLLIDLQTRCFQRHQECPDIHSRHFDMHDLLWETGYFTAQYLEGRRGLSFAPARKAALESVFTELARRVDAHPKSIMHRDFQSQNIMVQSGGILRVIDYQGSRLGSIYYDLASLLLDPYVMLPDDAVMELLRYYHAKSLNPLEFDAMFSQFLLAASQRIMQALGAYWFLSSAKGLPQFAAHIVPGERRLRWVTERAGWPELRDAAHLG